MCIMIWRMISPGSCIKRQVCSTAGRCFERRNTRDLSAAKVDSAFTSRFIAAVTGRRFTVSGDIVVNDVMLREQEIR